MEEYGTKLWEKMIRDFECTGVAGMDLNYDPQLPALDALIENDNAETDLYFYHGDHTSATLSTGLGSSSYITDINGYATQHMEYTRTELADCNPFGEDFISEQNSTSYYTPYTFSAKERDLETQYSYFGARYYDAGLSIWLSVDPMSDKAPDWTPYRYGYWNPMKYTDPTGMLETETDGDPPNLPTQPNLNGIGYSANNKKPEPNAPTNPAPSQSTTETNNNNPAINPAVSATVSAAGSFTEGLEQVSTSNANGSNTRYIQTVNGKARSPEVLNRANQMQSRSLANNAKIAGRGLNLLSVSMAGYQLASTENPTGADYARFAGSIVITSSAAIPVAGPLISVTLGVADSYGAFDGIYNMFK